MSLSKLLAVGLAALLASCVEMRVIVNVNADGSAHVEKRFGMSQEISKMSPGAVSNSKDSTSFAKDGFKVKSYTADGFTGVVGEKDVKSFDELKSAFSFNEDSLKSTTQNQPALRIEKGLFRNKYVLDASLDLAGKNKDESGAQMMQAMMSSARLEFVLGLPVKPEKHNATSVSADGKTLTWKFKMGEVNKFQLEAYAWNWLNLGAVGAGVLLLLILGLVAILRKRK